MFSLWSIFLWKAPHFCYDQWRKWDSFKFQELISHLNLIWKTILFALFEKCNIFNQLETKTSIKYISYILKFLKTNNCKSIKENCVLLHLKVGHGVERTTTLQQQGFCLKALKLAKDGFGLNSQIRNSYQKSFFFRFCLFNSFKSAKLCQRRSSRGWVKDEKSKLFLLLILQKCRRLSWKAKEQRLVLFLKMQLIFAKKFTAS